MKPFYDLADYPQFKVLIESYAIVAEEVRDLELWMKWGSDVPDETGRSMFKDGVWMVCPVYFGRGDPYSLLPPETDRTQVDQILKFLPQRFPKTVALLQNIPNIKFSGFSRLDPKSTLKPHRHQNPDSVILHLGLWIPPGGTCGLKVDDQVHIWKKPGDAVVFNDNYEHSAWNDSDETRIVLYADVLTPASPWYRKP